MKRKFGLAYVKDYPIKYENQKLEIKSIHIRINFVLNVTYFC